MGSRRNISRLGLNGTVTSPALRSFSILKDASSTNLILVFSEIQNTPALPLWKCHLWRHKMAAAQTFVTRAGQPEFPIQSLSHQSVVCATQISNIRDTLSARVWDVCGRGWHNLVIAASALWPRLFDIRHVVVAVIEDEQGQPAVHKCVFSNLILPVLGRLTDASLTAAYFTVLTI